ncbi:Wadjet anti-phage system protein JetD domain-containing protein [Acetobacterium sp.]|uniref:Wadjet anti-phage system protein JetD domain-containing protein n=1 Tax=Acetobacterium sp. TaxID=1872094 RepID=UPI002F3FAFB9
MSDKIQKNILWALLDKYERSNSFRDKKQQTRRILLHFYDDGKSDFPYYDIEQSERRISVNRAVRDLAELNLLSFEWMKGERDHIISKVWLNTDDLGFVYASAERKSKSDVVDEICMELLDMHKQVSSPWFKSYFQDAYATVSKRRSIGRSIPTDKEERHLLFKAICGIDRMNETEITERVFSIQCFGDSKKFEKSARSRIISILRTYLECDDDTRDGDLLRQVGIVKYPEIFEFCGNLSLVIESKVVAFAPLRLGSSISISDLVRGELIISPDVKRILTIENRANYFEYIQKSMTDDELVLYHAGQYSPSKKLFFLAIKEKMSKTCIWEHWGDIDYGGFSMLARLRREVLNGIKPFRMNSTELVEYKYMTASITAEYVKKLKSLTIKNELLDCVDCLDYLIVKKVRLEQESMLVKSLD